VPGFVDTLPFRFAFIGTTASLRAVLNELARFELPVVVRSVEVEPLNKGAATSVAPAVSSLPFNFGADSSAPQEQQKPIVEQTDSRFVVTVEFIALAEPNASAAPTP